MNNKDSFHSALRQLMCIHKNVAPGYSVNRDSI